MSVRIAERRRSPRAHAAYPAVLTDQRGQTVARGRTANISEHGLFLVVSGNISSQTGEDVIAKILVPSLAAHARGNETRTVIYDCRVVRRQALGQLVGLGIEFRKKLA